MKRPDIAIEPFFWQICPNIRIGCLSCQVKVHPSSQELLLFIQQRLEYLIQKLTIENIHNLPALHGTRAAYKALGKDPSRYRPSAEALLRRVVQGKGLYQINNVVDALNLISVSTGFSIGGYDTLKLSGSIRLGRGEEAEPYEAIGRGILNIQGLPVLRDEWGAFGSPTSDSLRTMVSTETEWFLATFFDFGNGQLEAALDEMAKLLEKHANGINILSWLV
jgi:DNA/RNA-binding domain of Phe-tRNA-synthetase-like protein